MKVVNTSRMHKCASTLAVVIPCFFLFLLVWTLNEGRQTLVASPGRDGQYSAVCTGDLLDQRHYRYEKEIDGTFRRTSDQSGSCRLLRYTTDRIVSCMDSLHYAKQLACKSSSRSPLFFVFLGDSRVRQHYINFVRLIPDYDQQMQLFRDGMYKFHGEVEITSDILRLRLAFKWPPFVDDNVTETIRRWATSGPSERPHFVLLNNSLFSFIENLLSNWSRSSSFSIQEIRSRVRPTGKCHSSDLAQSISDPRNIQNWCWTVEISEKLHNYNKAVRRVLRNENNRIRIWDSGNPLGEEYIRSCAILKRNEILHPGKRPRLFKETFYENCRDSIHTGYSALSLATNLLYNDICNNVMEFF